MGLFTGIKDYLKKISSNPTELPDIISIPVANTDMQEEVSGLFEPRQHYFTVRINEMYLLEEMEWFKRYEPVVMTITEFNYGGKSIEHPFLVGSNMMDEKIEEVAAGMIFHDTRVAGVHPFTGGKITTSIVLCKSKKDDLLKNTIGFIEKVTGLFSGNISNLINSYIPIATTVLAGVDTLFKKDDLVPVMGYRKEFDAEANDKLHPGYFVLLNKSEYEWDKNNFFVKENRLLYGDSLETAQEFREIEYVMFSITKSSFRNDYDTLPVYKGYQSIMESMKNIIDISEDKKKEISGRLAALNIDLKMSPDLVEPQAKALMNKWYEEIKEIVTQKFNLGVSSSPKAKDDFWENMQEKITSL